MTLHDSTPVRSAAFTLMELMIVIAIIAVLAGLAVPVMTGVFDRAKKVQAKNDLTQICVAANAFYTEYGRFPQPSSSTPAADVSYGDSNNQGTNKSYMLIDCLMAPPKNTSDSNAPTQNPRQIAFLQPKLASDPNNPRGGVDANGNYYDPWGRTYGVITDNSYDNVTQTYIPQYTDLAASYNTEPQSNKPGISGTCVGYSFGKDGLQGNEGNNQYRGSDDVLSWE